MMIGMAIVGRLALAQLVCFATIQRFINTRCHGQAKYIRCKQEYQDPCHRQLFHVTKITNFPDTNTLIFLTTSSVSMINAAQINNCYFFHYAAKNYIFATLQLIFCF